MTDAVDLSEIASDDQIRLALERKDDPDHDDAYSLADVRDALATVQRDLLAHIDEFDDTYDEPAYEDDELIIYADPRGDELEIAIDDHDLDDEDGIMSDVLSYIMHEVAADRCEYDWSAADPVVIHKPQAFRDGERHAMARLAQLIDNSDGAARGVDRWATEVMGLSAREWASETWTDRNHTGVSKNVRRGKRAAGDE